MFCISKVLRIPDKHPFCYQIGLTDAEINQLLSGVSDRTTKTINKKKNNDKNDNNNDDKYVIRQELANDDNDVCPICQDGMDGTQALTWCRKGCGQNIHAKCMQTFAQYKISNRDDVGCPLCRVPWLIEFLKEDCRKSTLKNTCKKVYCKSCSVQIKRGMFYRCIECSQNAMVLKKRPIDFCDNCFPGINMDHKKHHFISSDPRDSIQDLQWSYTANPRSDDNMNRNADILSVLQGREITTDDYDLLLSLDDKGSQDIYTHIINALPIYLPNSTSDSKFCWCKCDSTRNGITYRTLPCNHIAHQDCLRSSLVRGTADGIYCLGSLSCSHASCKQKIFHGLIRAKSSDTPKENNNACQHKAQKYPDVTGPGFDPSFQLAGTGLDLGLLTSSMSTKNIVTNAENAGLLTSNNQNIITSVRSIKQAINSSFRNKPHLVRMNTSENITLEGLAGSSIGTALAGSSIGTSVVMTSRANRTGKLVKPQRTNNTLHNENSFTSLYSRGPFLNIVPIGNREKKFNASQSLQMSFESNTNGKNSFIPVPPSLEGSLRSGFQAVIPSIPASNRELVSGFLRQDVEDELSISSLTNPEPINHGQSVIIGVDDHRLRRNTQDDEGFADSRMVMRRNNKSSKIPILVRHLEFHNDRNDDDNTENDDYENDDDEFHYAAR